MSRDQRISISNFEIPWSISALVVFRLIIDVIFYREPITRAFPPSSHPPVIGPYYECRAFFPILARKEALQPSGRENSKEKRAVSSFLPFFLPDIFKKRLSSLYLGKKANQTYQGMSIDILGHRLSLPFVESFLCARQSFFSIVFCMLLV